MKDVNERKDVRVQSLMTIAEFRLLRSAIIKINDYRDTEVETIETMSNFLRTSSLESAKKALRGLEKEDKK